MTSIAVDRLDGLSSATAMKGPCRVATTGNITLAGEQSIDGVAVVDGDRVLVKNQTAGAENGIYVADTGTWARAKDFSRNRDVVSGTQVYVTSGSVGAGQYYLTTANPIVVGSTSITWGLGPYLPLGANASDIDFSPTGGLAAIDVQAAIEELDGEKQPASASLTAIASAWTAASSSAPASLALAEDTDNGTNKITITAPASVASDKTLTLPDVTDTLVAKTTTDTLTNKRVTPRTTTITSSATPTVNTDNCDVVDITALATAITSMTTNLSGTPGRNEPLIFRIKDDGTARAITWGASFKAEGVALPTTTVISKQLTVGFIWNGSAWACIGSAQEA